MVDTRLAAVRSIVEEDWHTGNIGERISRIKDALAGVENPLEEVRQVLLDTSPGRHGKSLETIQLQRIRNIVLGEPIPMSDHDRVNYWYKKAQDAQEELKRHGISV